MVHGSPLRLLLVVSTCLVLCQQSVAEFRHDRPFGFLRGLRGWQKGQSAEELPKLKYYLGKFGYLNHLNDPSEGDPDDEYVENAIKAFQFNYHLNITGTLDEDTVRTMMRPRCGVPDVFHKSKTRMRLGSEKHAPPSLLHIVSHYTFFNNSPKWNDSMYHLRWKFASNYPDPIQVMDSNILRPIVERAFARWTAVTPFTFEEAKGGVDPDIKIAFHKGDHGDGQDSSFYGPGGSLAHAFSPSWGSLHYDAEERWSTNPKKGEYDIESITVHEIGHLIGLDHSSVREAIMYPSIGSGVLKRELHEDDVTGIRTLYGLPPLVRPPSVSRPPVKPPHPSKQYFPRFHFNSFKLFQ